MKRNIKNQSGQSLVEILIGLAVGAILIGGAGLGISFMLRSSGSNESFQTASGLVKEISEKVRAFGGANWHAIYNLAKGTDTHYFLNPTSTTLLVVEGEEGILDNDVMNGLVGKWNFDEASGTITYDGMGNSINGTLTNESIRSTSTCRVSNCVDFDGSNRINFTGANFKYTTGSFSYWIKFDEKDITGTIFHLYEGATTDYIRSHIDSNNDMDLVIEDDNSLKVYVTYDMDNLGEFTGNWYYIAWVQDGSSVKLYINGAEMILSGTNSGSWWSSHLLGDLVMRLGDGWAYFTGWLDDFRIYNRALSEAEIKRIYESGTYKRYFTLENACRTNDASSTISGVAPCGGGYFEDPSLQKITSYTTWRSGEDTEEVKIIDYLLRWKNRVFHQTDWSGGGEGDEVYVVPEEYYATSTNIDTDSGSIRLHNL